MQDKSAQCQKCAWEAGNSASFLVNSKKKKRQESKDFRWLNRMVLEAADPQYSEGLIN
jgi:hypothetical protein